MTPTLSAQIALIDRGDGYHVFRPEVAAHIAAQAGPVFTTSAEGLWELFLSHLPEASRQVYTCHACRHFVERYGGLVTIDGPGSLTSAVWPRGVPSFFQSAVMAIQGQVERARITGVFLTDQAVLGTQETPPWSHLAAPAVPASWRNTNRTQTAGQAMAEKREDYRMLQAAVQEFSQEVAQQALRVIRSDHLYRSAQVEGVATWLDALHTTLKEVRGFARHRFLWRAVATAPAGFCHVRSTMIGTLLEDIIEGLPFADISRRFAAKMHPLQYRRPTAPLAAGNMAQAETIMQQMDSAWALARRFATLADVEALWAPRPVPVTHLTSEGGKLFAHLRHAVQRPGISVVALPAKRMTWEKFAAEVLPTAETLALWIPNDPANYGALVTAVEPAAPSLFPWTPAVSWYVYHRGTLPAQWGLTPQTWHPVTALVQHPGLWRGQTTHVPTRDTFFVLLEGARDTRYIKGALFFPELLRREYHGVRATLEAYAQDAALTRQEAGDACGLVVTKDRMAALPWQVRVNGEEAYLIDRWD